MTKKRKARFTPFYKAQVDDIFTVRATKVRGAPQRSWMKDTNLHYRVTNPVDGSSTAKRQGWPGGAMIEVEPVAGTKGPKGSFLIRPSFELDTHRVMILLYDRQTRWHTTGHPIELVQHAVGAGLVGHINRERSASDASSSAMPGGGWLTGAFWRPADGKAWEAGPMTPGEADPKYKYLEMVRSPDDPKRSPRGQRRPDAVTELEARKWNFLQPYADIVELMVDGKPRTMNAMLVELYDMTAEMASSSLSRGLWTAVADKWLEVSTTKKGVATFRLRSGISAQDVQEGVAQIRVSILESHQQKEIEKALQIAQLRIKVSEIRLQALSGPLSSSVATLLKQLEEQLK